MTSSLLLVVLLVARPPEDVAKILDSAGIVRWQPRAELARRVKAAALDERKVLQWLAATPDGPTRSVLLRVLGEVGTSASFATLWRLEHAGVHEARQTADEILARLARQAGKPCVPPTRERIDRERAKLPASLPAQDREDRAYFLAAVSESGPRLGAAKSAPALRLPEAGDDPERDRAHRELESAERRGDLEAAAKAARAYLATLGYPGEVRHEAERTYAWGGARFSFVMRSLARLDEALGNLEEAADLYRNANPAGGACGTSAAYFWADQVSGLIRTEERIRGCNAVVAERLIGIDSDGAVRELGPERLAAAGFDVERLYRGALPLPEWERRIHAIEGLADVGRWSAVPTLLRLAGADDAWTARRAVEALGRLGARRCYPCMGIGLSGIGGWRRGIASLEEGCEKPLSDAERSSLAGPLVRFATEGPIPVRQAAIEALGEIASPAVERDLEALVADPTVDPDACVLLAGPDGPCSPVRAYGDKAKAALDRVRSVIEEAKRCPDEGAAFSTE